MKDYCAYVNVFQGCDEINLPEARGIAAKWKFIKGLCGNNTPAASLPFGKINAGCYSGGYSSGYGNLMKNTHGEIKKLFDKNKFRGISHLQNDGTGCIDVFYNYAVVSPFFEDISNAAQARDFCDEKAKPGLYSCRDSLTDAVCEVTMTRRAALHRITFGETAGRISVDFSNDGLYEGGEGLRFAAGKAEMRIISENEAQVCAVLHGIPIYFYIKADGIKGRIRLWADYCETDEKSVSLPENHRFGIVFDAQKQVSITLGISPKDAQTAQRDVTQNTYDFDTAARMAYDEWNNVLSAVEAEFDDDKNYEIFYSNLYHSLVKPCDFSGESFLYDGEDFVSELATIWDQYKTALPLIFTLYGGMASKTLGTLIDFQAATGCLPHTLMLCSFNEKLSTNQARMLGAFAVADAYYRGVEFDVKKALQAVYDDLIRNGHDEFARNSDKIKNVSYLIDITDACAACAAVARETGETLLAEKFTETADLWVNAYDKSTGLLKDSGSFYEGTVWNYSFRLVHDMEKRIALAGGEERFSSLADRFFGFAEQSADASVFEGYNNETDMESPYVYHFAGRHDRLSQIVCAGLEYMFTSGRGGLPGNNDSGGLSSCYIWNAVGIFPVSGQNIMIIGSPLCRKTTFRLFNNKEFNIIKNGKGIYVCRADLNGRELDRLCFSVRDMMNGGTLTLTMSDSPVIK